MSAVVYALSQGKTRRLQKLRAASARRHPLRLYAVASTQNKFFLYAMGFADGTTKIGYTQRPFTRFGLHYDRAKGEVAWVHLFGPQPNRGAALSVERDALNRARAIGTVTQGREWFHGLTKADALRCVRESDADHRLMDSDIERTARVKSSSRLLGASWHKAAGGWVAQICVHGHKRHLGVFKTAAEAHAIYLVAKRALHEGCTL